MTKVAFKNEYFCFDFVSDGAVVGARLTCRLFAYTNFKVRQLVWQCFGGVFRPCSGEASGEMVDEGAEVLGALGKVRMDEEEGAELYNIRGLKVVLFEVDVLVTEKLKDGLAKVVNGLVTLEPENRGDKERLFAEKLLRVVWETLAELGGVG